MNHRFSFVSSALCALALGASLVAACGGRFQAVHEVDDDTGSGGSDASSAGRAGAPSAHAGSSSVGTSGSTSVGVSGSSSGGVSSAGSSGASGCNNVKCAAPACPVNTAPAVQPGMCCPICVSTCPKVCPTFKCGAGSHVETLPGSCCPTCVDDGAAACQMGQQAYAAYRDALLTKYQFGCASNSECVNIAPVNLCEQGCSYAAVWYGISDSFDTNLSNSAGMYCSSCKQGPVPPCAPPPNAICVGGQCQSALK